MTRKEKEDYCTEKGIFFKGRYFSANLVIAPDKIDGSISYVLSLKNSPAEEEINELAEEVKSGVLEWAYQYEDEFKKTMGFYAHRILGDR